MSGLIIFNKTKKNAVDKVKNSELTPVINYINNVDNKESIPDFIQLHLSLSAWNMELKSNFKENVADLIEKLKSKPVTTLVLGSGKNKTKIWDMDINGRNYILFYSKRGISLEGTKNNSLMLAKIDLTQLLNHMNLPLSLKDLSVEKV